MKKHWQLIIFSLLQTFLVHANASDDRLAVNDLYNLGLNLKSAARTDAFLPSSFPSSAGSNGSINYELSKVELWGFLTSSKDNYPIQLGAFRLKSNAESFFEKVKNTYHQ